MKVQVLKNQKKNICPICKKEIIGYPALSRKDNKTEICSKCGELEGLMKFIQYEQRNKSNKKRSNKKCV